MRRLPLLVLVLSLVPSGCALAQSPPEHPLGAVGAFFARLFHGAKQAAPKPQIQYVVGPPYELDGTWQYPRERFSYDETGIAGVYPPGHPALTTSPTSKMVGRCCCASMIAARSRRRASSW